MKKILVSLICAMTLSSIAMADIVKVEIGAGAWMQTPKGTASYNVGGGGDGTNTFDKTEDTSPYVWLLIKHPIPVLPNIRLEYTSIHATGKASGEWNNIAIPTGLSSNSTLDLIEYDIIPYYNLLDNTAWITLDIGLDMKVTNSDYTIDPKNLFTGYEDKSTIVIPLGYVRARVEVPFTGLGLESDVKYITDGTSTIYDIRAKVDYTFDISPMIQPAIEVGYRTQKLQIDESGSDVKTDVYFSGFYSGLMLRF